MKLDKEEIGELWDKITPKLYGYLINTLKDSVLADDILQTTWTKAIESLSNFNKQDSNIVTSFSSWLFSIARNEMRMHWRKNGREIEYDIELHDLPTENKREEDKILVEQTLIKLPKEDRELIRLRYIADLSLGEIAKLLNLNPINVRVKMHRALSRARVIFKQQIYEI